MVRSAATPERAAVRVRLKGAKNKSSTELLAKAKKVIPGAFTVRQLRSGNVDVMVLN